METRHLHSKVAKKANAKKTKSICTSFVRRITVDESEVTELPHAAVFLGNRDA